MGSGPFGANPPWRVRFATLADTPGHKPKTYTPPTTKNATMAATLIDANQNSNSPNDLTDMRFVPVSSSSNTKLISQVGSPGNQKRTRPAPATASRATTMTQKYQYIQPVKNPANAPMRGRSLHARRAYS